MELVGLTYNLIFYLITFFFFFFVKYSTIHFIYSLLSTHNVSLINGELIHNNSDTTDTLNKIAFKDRSSSVSGGLPFEDSALDPKKYLLPEYYIFL